MNFNDFDEQDQIQPHADGVEVFMVGHPKLIKDDKGKKIEFTYKQVGKAATRTFNKFDIFDVKPDTNEKLVAANKRQLLSLYGACMLPEAFEQFKAGNYEDLEEFHNTAIKFLDPDVAKLKLKIMIGYTQKGYVDFNTFGSCISSKHRERQLIFDPNGISLKPSLRAKDKPDHEDSKPDNEDI